MIRLTALIALTLVAGCTSRPGVGVYRAADGTVTSSVSGGVGPVDVGVNSAGGGFLGTSVGGVSIGMGF